jgi:hypothetical protein
MLRDKKWGSMVAVGVLTILCGLMYGTAHAAGPDPNEVYVQSISYGGTGCPQGTIGQSFSDDRTTFTLIFDAYIASSGPGVPITEARKNCQLNFNLHIPPGAGNTLLKAEYRGFVQLSAGAGAQRGAIYYLPGGLVNTADGETFNGPISTDYLGIDVIPLYLNKVDVHGACNAVIPINANNQIRISGDMSMDQQITIDSIDGTIQNTGAPDAGGC